MTATVYRMRDDPFYSTDYFSARDRFRAAAATAGCIVESFPIDALGPDEQALTIDVARCGPENAEKLVILSSGLHGVEGFFGSAVQLAWLDAVPKHSHVPAGTAVLLLHALNPYGFSWLRRFNEDGVDPNRNCLLPGSKYAGSPPGYAELDALLNPPSPPPCCGLFFLQAIGHILAKGMPALKQAVAAGQYDFPKGLFYGGAGPSQSLQILSTHLPDWVRQARRILHVDFHTGLGKWSSYKLLAEYGLTDVERTWLSKHFDATKIEDAQADGVAYEVRGGFGQWCKHLLAHAEYTYLCAEFGTYGPLNVLAGLRAENRAAHWGDAEGKCTHRAKRRLRELFCPSSGNWRSYALGRGLDLIRSASAAVK